MSTQPENDDGDMAENNIQDEYFEDTPVKEWKIIGALAYYIKQNVGTFAAYTLIEVSLRAMNTRNTAKKRGESLLEELGVLKAIHERETFLPSSAELPNATTKIADEINNIGNINQTKCNYLKQLSFQFIFNSLKRERVNRITSLRIK
ncbi:unnamed protein product [Mucor hiemalis]